MKDYTFLTRTAYITELTDAASHAKTSERIVIATMDFDPREPLVQKLCVALQTAAGKGANVTFLVDAINFLIDKRGQPGPLFYGRSLNRVRGQFADRYQALEAIKAAGGKVCITNIPTHRFRSPFSGRSHIKGAVLDNRVFVGGCNLEHPKYLDVMVSWINKSAADKLAAWLLAIAETAQARASLGDVDVEASLDATTSLLLDAGVPRQSLIFDEALQLIDDAQEWIYLTCQYFPGGPTARRLATAQARGVSVEINYSHPRAHAGAAALHHIHQLTQRTRHLPKEFFSGRLDKQAPKLHAKVLISEKTALVGSHNYVVQGVNFGTAELALRSRDPLFGMALKDFMRRQV